MKKISYQPKQVRIFLTLLLLLALALTLRLTHRLGTPGRLAVLLGEIAVIGTLMAVPKVFFPVYKIILTASGLLGNLIFAVISILVFYLILTPISLAMRLAGKRFMSHRIGPSLPTYYEEAEERHDIKKQF